MTNHPNRSKREPQSIAVDAALKAILADHDQYKRVDAEGRKNIRRQYLLSAE